jgi:hypothetical protein
VRCGDYRIERFSINNWSAQQPDDVERALASYHIRKSYKPRHRHKVEDDFFTELGKASLPSPIEAQDNFLLYLSARLGPTPGQAAKISVSTPWIFSEAGVVNYGDLEWIVDDLINEELIIVKSSGNGFRDVCLTGGGWRRVDDLKKARVTSNFAFFARRFNNDDLDRLFEECLRKAVKEAAGFELRIASQKAGLIDSIIEDEIRRCRFLLADLSDDNPGAYWEAGFAEGLGKPVIYLCAEKDKNTGEDKTTHFDTSHRHTVYWDLEKMNETAKRLKSVIRNTLLGDALQEK